MEVNCQNGEFDEQTASNISVLLWMEKNCTTLRREANKYVIACDQMWELVVVVYLAGSNSGQ